MTTTSFICLQRLYNVTINVYDRFDTIFRDLISAQVSLDSSYQISNKELKKALKKAEVYDANLKRYFYILSDMLYKLSQCDIESLSDKQKESIRIINYQVDRVYNNYINA